MHSLFSFGVSLLTAYYLNLCVAQEAPVFFLNPWWVPIANPQRYVVPFKLLPWHLRSWQRPTLNVPNVNQSAQFRSGSYEVVPRIPGAASLVPAEDRQLGSFVRRLNDLRDIWSLCTSGGRMGNCLPSALCSLYGGTPSGIGTACLFSACCIKIIHECDSIITINSTYWHPPPTIGSSCKVTVKLDSRLADQRRLPICQVRLEFESFSIGQPDSTGKCSGDSFSVTGAQNRIPTICGDNDGQHMFLTVPPTLNERTTIDLNFKFSSSASQASTWSIAVQMLPCTSRFLAPRDCLQYFIQSSGIGFLKSFNWKDVTSPGVAGTSVRQLANQDYTICIRTETVTKNDDRATQICYTPCTSSVGSVTTFSVSHALDSGARSDLLDCLNDYIGIPGATDGSNFADRFCGTYFNPYSTGAPGSASVKRSTTVCSSTKPFRVIIKTDDNESSPAKTLPNGVSIAAQTDVGNIGFCLQFQQKL